MNTCAIHDISLKIGEFVRRMIMKSYNGIQLILLIIEWPFAMIPVIKKIHQ